MPSENPSAPGDSKVGDDPDKLREAIAPYILSERWWQRLVRWALGCLCLAGAAASTSILRRCGEALLTFVIRHYPHGWLAAGGLSLFYQPVGALLSLQLLHLAWRLFARRGDAVLRRDTRAPIVYLRSFADDAGNVDRGGWWRILFPWVRYETYERVLAQSVSDLAPMLAIGRPGERLPPLGAARLYVPIEWQAVVTHLVAACRLVILRVGGSRGFRWEIQHIIERCDPAKVLIYLPKEDRTAKYKLLRDLVQSSLSQTLPESPGSALFLGFGPGWQPELLGSRGPGMRARLRRILAGSAAAVIRAAINDGLAARGNPVRRLPLKAAEWAQLLVRIPTAGITLALVLGIVWTFWRQHSWEQSFVVRSHVIIECGTPGDSVPSNSAWAGKMEQILAGIPGVRRLEAVSRSESSVVALELDTPRDRPRVVTAVQQRLSAAGVSVGDDAQARILPPVDDSLHVFTVTSPTLSAADVSLLAAHEIAPRLKRLEGVSDVHMIGPPPPRQLIYPAPTRLASYGINLDQVVVALKGFATGHQNESVKPEDLMTVPITQVNGAPVRIGDVCSNDLSYGRPAGHQASAGGIALYDEESRGLAVVLRIDVHPGFDQKIDARLETELAAMGKTLSGNVTLEYLKWPSAVLGLRISMLPASSAEYERTLERMTRTAASESSHGFVIKRSLGFVDPDGTGALLWISELRSPPGYFAFLSPPFVHATATAVALQRKFEMDLPGTQESVRTVAGLWPIWPAQGTQIVARVLAQDYPTAQKKAAAFAARLRDSPEVRDVTLFPDEKDWLVTRVEMRVNESACQRFGVRPEEAARILDLGRGGEIELPGLRCGNLPVALALDSEFVSRDTPGQAISNLDGIFLQSENGAKVSVTNLVDAKTVTQPAAVFRSSGRYAVVVSCNAQVNAIGRVRTRVREIAHSLQGTGFEIELEQP